MMEVDIEFGEICHSRVCGNCRKWKPGKGYCTLYEIGCGIFSAPMKAWCWESTEEKRISLIKKWYEKISREEQPE